MAKLNFQQPLLQSSVSHDPSENFYKFLYCHIWLNCVVDRINCFFLSLIKSSLLNGSVHVVLVNMIYIYYKLLSNSYLLTFIFLQYIYI